GITDIVNTITNGTDEDRQALLNELVEYIALSEVDMENYDKDVSNLINTVTDLLKSVKIKPLIDGLTELKIPGMSEDAAKLLGMATPVVKAIIAEQVTLEKLGATVELKLKSDYAVDTVSVELFASHDYEGDSELPLLSDNDYSANISLKLTGHSNELEASHELDFAPYNAETKNKLPDSAVSVMQLFGEENVVAVYIETRMFDEVEVDGISVAYVDGNGERHDCDAENVVEFVGSSFVFKVNGIQTAASAEIANGVGVNYVDMQANVSYGDGEEQSYDVNIRLYIVSDASTDSAADLITRIANSLK
ncbi:MAG: hypothetical protein K2M48_00095, partial [Clostridiales bacterium]|nr:hypothetical protein [Clostridiales bacterium]